MIKTFATIARYALVSSALLTSTMLVPAAEYYATPSGAGSQNGSSWANAHPQSQIQAALDGLQPGDTLNLGSGTYTISSLVINGSGTSGSSKGLIGVDTGGGLPLFQGTFDVHNNASSNFINFPGAAHYWEFKNLRFTDQPFVINMPASGTTDTLRTNIVFDNLHFDTIEDAIRLRNASSILVRNCTVIRHTKKAFRTGDYCSFITYDNCATDCNGGDLSFPSRSIPTGFGCDPTDNLPIIHDITYIDCIARNNGYTQGSSNYWQGDGFTSERGAYNITYLRCKAYDNRDGGFDNKASFITYQDCVSAGNSRGFRHWADHGQMFNCVASYNLKYGGTGSSYGIWISKNGGQLTVEFSTIHGEAHGILVETGGTGTITVSDSIISTTSATAAFASAGATLINTATYRPGEGTDPDYVADSPSWRGIPVDAMDSQAYGLTKGYNSSQVNGGDTEAPSVPTGLTADSIAPNSFNLSWAASTDNVVVIGYDVFIDGGLYASPSATGVSVTGLSPNTNYSMTVRAYDAAGNASTQSSALHVTTASDSGAIRIEAGGSSPFTDSNGQVWAADYGFDAGVGGAVDRGAIAIANTIDDRIYQTERWGLNGYAIPIANGDYTVNLHFAETYSGITAAGQRVFSVTAEGATPSGWSDIDLFAEAGGRDIALVKTAAITVSDGTLNLGFSASIDNPLLNGIEIIPQGGGADTTPPSVPTGLAAGNITSSSFTLSWSASTDNVGVTGYQVLQDGVSIATPTGTSVNVTGLSPNTNYSMTVRARDAAGNWSAQSNTLNVTTSTASGGYDIIIDNADGSGVTITGSWIASTYTAGYHGSDYLHDDNTGKGSKSVRFTPNLPTAGEAAVYARWTTGANRATNVPIDINHAGGTSTVTVDQQQNNGAWVSLGNYTFDAGTSGNLTIRTSGTSGYVIADAVRFESTGASDTQPPSIPDGLVATSVTSTSFTLSWTASTDNVGVTGYEVLLDDAPHATVTGTSTAVTSLAANTSYSVTVRARDAAGNWSAESTPLDVVTDGGSIGVNLGDGVNALAAGDIVGAVPAGNWNNSTANNDTITDVIDSSGAATTADVSFSNTAYAYTNNTADPGAPLTDDAKMMRSQRAKSNASNMSVVASEVPYAAYDVYVYWGGRTPQEAVPHTMALEFQLWNGSTWVTVETKYIRDDDRVWDGTYDESTATSSGAATDGNEFVVFRDVTDSSFRIVVNAGVRTGLCGLQIVEQ